MNPFYKSPPKVGRSQPHQAEHKPQPVLHQQHAYGLHSPEMAASPANAYAVSPYSGQVYYDQQQQQMYRVQYKYVPFPVQQQQQQQQPPQQHSQSQSPQLPHTTQGLHAANMQLQPSPIIHQQYHILPQQQHQSQSHQSQHSSPQLYTHHLPPTPAHSHSSHSRNSSLSSFAQDHSLRYKEALHSPPQLSHTPKHEFQGVAPHGSAAASSAGGAPPAKRHKKSKSFPDSRHFDTASHHHHSSSSNSTRKSHCAEAPSSKDVKFPIAKVPGLAASDCPADAAGGAGAAAATTSSAATTPVSFPPAIQSKLRKLYASIEVKKYSTSAIDPVRNYLTVYEYPINKNWVIWDYETGFVHLTGIWKASICDAHDAAAAAAAGDPHHQGGPAGHAPAELVPKSHSKADIVKLLETTPKHYQQYIKRIRGGFLKIQGTWLPYDLCKIVARKFCYHIRYELIPLFGADFPDSCLTPDDSGFGKLRLDESCETKEKKPRRVSSSTSAAGSSAAGGAVAPASMAIPPTVPAASATATAHRRSVSLGGARNKLYIPAATVVPAPAAAAAGPAATAASVPVKRESINVSPIATRPHLSSSSSANVSPNSEFPTGGRPGGAGGAFVFPDTASYSYMFGSTVPSYSEMMDIVTASKCLQSLRSGTTRGTLEHPFSSETRSAVAAAASAGGPGAARPDAATTRPSSSTSTSPSAGTPASLAGGRLEGIKGISSILEAANLRDSESSRATRSPPASAARDDKRRISLKIHDLIS